MRKQMPANCYKFSHTYSRFFCKVQCTCASFSLYISFGLGRASVIAQFIIKCQLSTKKIVKVIFPDAFAK